MSLVVVRQHRKVFFGYVLDHGEGMPQRSGDICSTSFLDLQVIPYKKRTYLVYYAEDVAPVEKMILRNGLVDLLEGATPLSSKSLVHSILPKLIAVYRAVGCLHTQENGKSVTFSGDFFLIGQEGIFEIDSNQDVSFFPDFLASDSELTAYLCAGKEAVDLAKAKECLKTSAWRELGGHRIYFPVIMGYLGDKEATIYDGNFQPHPFKMEELVCH